MFSTTFSILVVMVMLNIVTVDDLVVILKLSPEAATALKLVVERLREVTGNIVDILSQLLNKLFGWAGIEVDLSKIIFYQIEYVDVWIRDYGPTFIKDNNKISWIKWQYDYYGGKFPELSKDNNVFLNLKEKIDFTDFLEQSGYIESKEELIKRFDENRDAKDNIKEFLQEHI